MAKRPKLTDMQIQVIVTNELSNANVTASSPTFLRDPLAYYLGLPNGSEVVGRSQITSTDVADAIEWIIPQIMKSFTQNNEIVVFDAVNEQDTKQAELESEYVYDILMKKNNGFILIHQFVKDALMQRNGVLKVYYEDNEDITYEEYTGLNEVQLQMLLADKEVELMKMTQNEFIDNNGQLQTEYDVKISITKKSGKIWYGDVDITMEFDNLKSIADELKEDLYILYESDARFEHENAGFNFWKSRAVAVIKTK